MRRRIEEAPALPVIKSLDDLPVTKKVVAGLEAEPDINVSELPVGAKVIIKTRNTKYLLEIRPDGQYISGHPQICPEPSRGEIIGSTYGDTSSNLHPGLIRSGLHLEFRIGEDKPNTTSAIKTIERVS
jgi:hypothetical protein